MRFKDFPEEPPKNTNYLFITNEDVTEIKSKDEYQPRNIF